MNLPSRTMPALADRIDDGGPKLRLSIVVKLALLAVAIAVPLTAILAWNVLALFRSQVTAAEQQATHLTADIALRAEDEVGRTRSMLKAIVERPAVQAMDRSRCDNILAELQHVMPQYANINTLNLQWEVVCSVRPLQPGNIVHSKYSALFERMKAVDEMVMSGPVRGQITGKMVVIAAYPVKDAQDRIVGAATAPIDLALLAPIITGANLPAMALVRVVDGAGYVVTSLPDDGRTGARAGRVADMAIARRSGASIELGRDGIERIYAYIPVRGTDWVVITGLPTASTFAAFRRNRNEAVAGVLLAFALSAWLALILARRISHPIHELRKDALALAGGQLGRRARVTTTDEVGQLAVAFNSMAQALQANDDESRRASEDLRESERRFSDVLTNVELASVMLDREGRITFCNEYLLRLTGWKREEIVGRSWFELFMASGKDEWAAFFPQMLANSAAARHRENEIITRSGEARLMRWSNSVLRSGAGDVIGTASIGEDVTDQKHAELKIERLNRVYAMLSGINTLIVHAHSRDELFREACRIAVDEGGFRMSMIGILDRGTMSVVPVASAGKDDALLGAIEGVLSSTDRAPTTMVAQAIREKQAVVSNDSQGDPRVLFGKQYVESGIRSMAVLPLLVADRAVGVLALYGAEPGVFDDEELKLLTELARDIAFGIDHLDKQERLDYLAMYDAVTGLANRMLFLERLREKLLPAKDDRRKTAVFVLDIERFRTVNEAFGHTAGDTLLKRVAERLVQHGGNASRFAHLGADRFAIAASGFDSVDQVGHYVEQRLDATFRESFRMGDNDLRVSVKVGIAVYPEDGADAETLLRNAEAALIRAKAGGDRYLFFTHGMTERVAEHVALESRLRHALENGEFVLHYQPKVSLQSGKLTGAEALIRWNDPLTGLVPPGTFIPILEVTGLIHEVGRWALRQAIADHLRCRTAGLTAVRLSVNVSPLQLRSRGFVGEIEQAIGVDPAAAAGLELEITESVIMEDVERSIATLAAIRALGVTIAIDDFGTGFSSLSYLSRLPVDTLKIDRSFVTAMTVAPEGLALVSTIINLAHSMKCSVVAEGVETEEQSRLLRLLNCDEMQGYLFSKPLPGEIFEAKYLSRSTETRAAVIT